MQDRPARNGPSCRREQRAESRGTMSAGPAAAGTACSPARGAALRRDMGPQRVVVQAGPQVNCMPTCDADASDTYEHLERRMAYDPATGSARPVRRRSYDGTPLDDTWYLFDAAHDEVDEGHGVALASRHRGSAAAATFVPPVRPRRHARRLCLAGPCLFDERCIPLEWRRMDVRSPQVVASDTMTAVPDPDERTRWSGIPSAANGSS